MNPIRIVSMCACMLSQGSLSIGKGFENIHLKTWFEIASGLSGFCFRNHSDLLMPSCLFMFQWFLFYSNRLDLLHMHLDIPWFL